MASSRRGASDIHILAMLDGLGSRPHAKRHMLWYGAGGILVCGLVGILAWLAHEPATRLDSTMVQGGLPPAPVAASPASAPQERSAEASPAAADSASEPAPVGGATIVDVAAEAAPAAPEPVEHIHSVVMPKPVPALHMPASKSPASRVPPAHAVAGVHPAAVHPASKRSAPAIKPAPAPAAVDTDVALISAIIQHAAKQREAVDNSGCNDKPCGPRMPPQP